MWSSMCQQKLLNIMPTYNHGTTTPAIFSSMWRSMEP